jgi:hypothetical protein
VVRCEAAATPVGCGCVKQWRQHWVNSVLTPPRLGSGEGVGRQGRLGRLGLEARTHGVRAS